MANTSRKRQIVIDGILYNVTIKEYDKLETTLDKALSASIDSELGLHTKYVEVCNEIKAKYYGKGKVIYGSYTTIS